jgi:hypothetical protein
VRLRKYRYTAVPTVEAKLTTAAPMMVPATPRYEAATAPVSAASTLAVSWTRLSSRRFWRVRILPRGWWMSAILDI